MSGVEVAVAVAAAGTLMQGVGMYNANLAEADANRRNAQSAEANADYVLAVGRRKMDLLEKNQRAFLGAQKSALIKNGIGFSGSVLDLTVSTEVEQNRERRALATEVAYEANAARSAADNYRRRADALSDPMNNFLQFGGRILTGASGLIPRS